MAGEISYQSYRVTDLNATYLKASTYGSNNNSSNIPGTPSSGNYILKTGDTATGSYIFNTSLFVINSTTNRVGIGTASPSYLFDVNGSARFQGGIIPSVGNDSSHGINFPANPGGGSGDEAYIRYFVETGEVTRLRIGIDDEATDRISFWQMGADRVSIYNGNVGIGTDTPYEKLEVSGAISATGDPVANAAQGPAITMYYNTGNDYGVIQGCDWGSTKDIVLQLSGGNVGIGIAPTSNYKLNINGPGYFNGYLYAGSHTGTITYSSGFAGAGWQIYSAGGDTTLTIDNLVVRKALTAYELNINRINSVNGGLIVSVANGKSIAVAGTNILFDEDNGRKQIQFVVNDYIRAQIWTGRGIASYVGLVTAVNHSNTYGLAYIVATTISGTPWNEMELVQIGNTTDAARQNLIYITASDTNNPYIDMLAGVNTGNFAGKQKLRIGNLTGITDSDFGGDLSGYGLYANNVYLKGNITITAGSVPWSTVDGAGKPADNATVGAEWATNLSGIPSPLTTPTGSGLFLSSSYLGFYSSSAWKVYIDSLGNFSLGDAVNGNTGLYWSQSAATLKIIGEINATSGVIGGWSINSSYIAKDTGTDSTSAGMSPTDYPYYAGATYANRESALFRVSADGTVRMGNTTITTELDVNYIKIAGVPNSVLQLANNSPYTTNAPYIKLTGTSSNDSYFLLDANVDPVINGLPGIKLISNYQTSYAILTPLRLEFTGVTNYHIKLENYDTAINVQFTGLKNTSQVDAIESGANWKQLWINVNTGTIARSA